VIEAVDGAEGVAKAKSDRPDLILKPKKKHVGVL
jgi:hypothetical protein